MRRVQAMAASAGPAPAASKISANATGLQQRRRGPPHPTRTGPHQPAAVLAPAAVAHGNGLAPARPGPPRRPDHVTQGEYTHRLSDGLCIWCGSAEHVLRACPNKVTGLYPTSFVSKSRVVLDSTLSLSETPQTQQAAQTLLRRSSRTTRKPQYYPPPPLNSLKRPATSPPLAAGRPSKSLQNARPVAPVAATLAPVAPTPVAVQQHVPVVPVAAPVQVAPAPVTVQPEQRVPVAPNVATPVAISVATQQHVPVVPNVLVAAPVATSVATQQHAPVAPPAPTAGRRSRPVRISTNLHILEHTLLTLQCQVGYETVTVLFDPGSTHNLVSLALVNRLSLPAQGNATDYQLRRAGTGFSRFSTAAVKLPVSFPPGSAPSLPFTETITAVPVPDGLAPYDILIGKPWFSRRNKDLEVNWESNTLTLKLPSGVCSWTAVSPMMSEPDSQPESSDINLTNAEIDELILSPARAARILRKPGQARVFVAFPFLQQADSSGTATSATPQAELSPSMVSSNATSTSAASSAEPDTRTSPNTSATDRLGDVTIGKHAPPALRALLQRFKHVFDELPPGIPPDRGAPFRIDTTPGADPPARPPFRLSFPERQEMQKQLRSLISLGYMSPTISPYAAPVFFVIKPDGKLRMVVDWRGLNNITSKNRYHLPNLEDLFDQLSQATTFSKMDLASGFYQVPIHPDDRHKTAMITPFGNYQWNVMGMGLSNAPAAFQTLMERVLQPFLGKFVVVFIDDILIFSNSPEDHLTHIEQVLSALLAQRLFAKRRANVPSSRHRFFSWVTVSLTELSPWMRRSYQLSATGQHPPALSNSAALLVCAISFGVSWQTFRRLLHLSTSSLARHSHTRARFAWRRLTSKRLPTLSFFSLLRRRSFSHSSLESSR